jgi:spermidine/putrescine transport system permease protein
MSELLRSKGLGVALFAILGCGFWVVLMIVLPQLGMAEFSLHRHLPRAELGGPGDVYTLEHYRYLAGNTLHLQVLVRTIVSSILITALALLFCYPLAYYAAQVASPRRGRLVLLLLVLPFWVNEILRALAFRIILGTGGTLNAALLWSGVVDEPIDFLRSGMGVPVGLIYAYLLLMVFPLYNAIETLGRGPIEAARDLGASWRRIHLRIVIPHARSGIASGCVMVFMLTVGSLAMPQFLGGTRSLWFAEVIYQAFNSAGNWPRGGAYAFTLLVTCIVLVMLCLKLLRVRLGEVGR